MDIGSTLMLPIVSRDVTKVYFIRPHLTAFLHHNIAFALSVFGEGHDTIILNSVEVEHNKQHSTPRIQTVYIELFKHLLVFIYNG